MVNLNSHLIFTQKSPHFQDEVLIEDPKFREFWYRNVEESIRQKNVKPFIEETMLLVSNWGFSLADLRVQRKCQRTGILTWLKSLYSQEECELAGFVGPIHIWQVRPLLFSSHKHHTESYANCLNWTCLF